MSSQKGNASRSRPQKYQNRISFKNDLHDTSHKTKIINNLQIVDVCERCKKIIEWKIKYKKYKPLKAPGTCTKCTQKAVKHTYHTICLPCAKQHEVCPKCGIKAEIIEACSKEEDPLQSDRELQALLKSLPERKRRTFIRYVNKNAAGKRDVSLKKEDKHKNADETEGTDDNESLTRDMLVNKLKSMAVKDEEEHDFEDSDESDWNEYFS